MKYRVIVGWRCEFEFDYAMDAMMFADTAAKHKTDGVNDVIRIEIIVPEEQDKEEEQADDVDETV